MPDRDGSFQLEYRAGLAYLTVQPPEENGRPVYLEDVINRMKILGISTICADTVAEAVNQAEGTPVELIEWPHGVDLMSKAEITLAEDHMSATLRLSEPKKGGGIPALDDIKAQLAAAGIVWGIDEEAISQAIKNRIYDTDIRAASGRSPKAGQPARAEFTFVHEPGKPYVYREDGGVDLKELNFIQNKKKDDVLAKILIAEEPVPGTDVLGQEIPPPPTPREKPIKAGQNTAFSKSGDRIIALIDGNAYLKGNAVCMESVVQVQRVDYETGNLKFDGAVVVRESVADGFTVEADGAIEIGECLGRATIHGGRDVHLRGGMNGDGVGLVRAGGSICAKFIENARISCAGNLIVDELLMHTDFVTGGDLVMRGRRGEFLGGNGVVAGSFWCKQLGSPSEVPTRVSLGIEPSRLNAFISMKREVEELSIELDEVNRKITGLKKVQGNANSAKYAVIKAKLDEKARELEAAVREKKRQLTAERASLVPSTATVAVIEGTAYPKSVVAFGEEEFRVRNTPLEKTVLRYRGGKIVEGGYNPNEPPKLASMES
jgi:uncharacterized protein